MTAVAGYARQVRHVQLDLRGLVDASVAWHVRVNVIRSGVQTLVTIGVAK